jgi:hypothetical protein
MSTKARHWFLTWGLFFAIFAVRGLLPWLIVWIVNPGLGFLGSLTATFSSDAGVQDSIAASAPILLAGGGTFLIFLFFHWLFMEEKQYGFPWEKFFNTHAVWFYAVVSILLTAIVWQTLQVNPQIAFSVVVGSSVFFITHGFKQNAELQEQKLLSGKNSLSDLSKIFYLEIIDTTFSIDGVLGAFAFTMSIPIIILGNGLGALILRQFTVSNVSRISKFVYLKNGAMYSVLCLGIIMLADALGVHIPHWFSPIATFIIVGYFFWLSLHFIKKQKIADSKSA